MHRDLEGANGGVPSGRPGRWKPGQRAALQSPDVFKVGVATAGNHDQRGHETTWGEFWVGLPEGVNYAVHDDTCLADAQHRRPIRNDVAQVCITAGIPGCCGPCQRGPRDLDAQTKTAGHGPGAKRAQSKKPPGWVAFALQLHR